MVPFVMRCGWCLKSCRKTIPSNTDATAETTSHKDACTAAPQLAQHTKPAISYDRAMDQILVMK